MRSSYVRSMAFQSTDKFLLGLRWVLGSLLFLADKFGDLSLQELESWEIAKSSTGRQPPAPIRVGLINKIQLGHGLRSFREQSQPHPGCYGSHNRFNLVAPLLPL
jgi:hypothetical protein